MVVMIRQPNMAYVSAIVAGTSLVAGWWWWERRRRERLPEKWRKVGELVDILCYPIKSLGPVRLDSMECTQLGLKFGWLRDRTLMVVDQEGKCVTARHHPKMIKITPNFDFSVLTLKAPESEPVSIDLAKLDQRGQADVWGDVVTVYDCGDEVAKWLSKFILEQDKGLRLVYYPLDTPMRPISKKNKNFPLVTAKDSGAFPDETSFSMQNLTSIEELNTRLESPVSIRNFRMNFSIKSAKPFEEDFWDWVKIGNVVFRNIMPCTRCLFTTVDPETATKSPVMEPLKTLRTYRKVNDARLKSVIHESPLFGIHLGLRSNNGNNVVRLGDSIYVNEETQQIPIVQPINTQ